MPGEGEREMKVEEQGIGREVLNSRDGEGGERWGEVEEEMEEKAR